MTTIDPATPSIPPRVSIVHRLAHTSNLYIAHVQHAGVSYTIEAEAERSHAKLTGLYIEPIPPFAEIPAVINKGGQALYIAAVRALTAGDTHTHRLLIGVSGSVSAYALGLQRSLTEAA